VTGATVRVPAAGELERLREIEVAAGAAFAHVGLPEIAADEPPAFEELAAYLAAGRVWIAADQGDRPVAYVLVDLVDGAAHVEQVSVHPDQARQGIGRMLLDHVARWAAKEQLRAVTLTTFRDVPWNAPYYARCGFRLMEAREIGPELRALRQLEAEHGLALEHRVCMIRSHD
jgi:GNAT superfamily N-acetyltransferase